MKTLSKVASVFVVALIAMLAVTSCSKNNDVTSFQTAVNIFNKDNLSTSTIASVKEAMDSAMEKWKLATVSGANDNEMSTFINNYAIPAINQYVSSDQLAELKANNTYLTFYFTSLDLKTVYVTRNYYFNN